MPRTLVNEQRVLSEVPTPHPVSAAAVVLGTTYVASVLPWKGAPQGPWTGSSLSARMEAAVDELEPFLAGQERQVWGGDWNQTMHGPFDGSSKAGRARLQLALERLELSLPTQELPRGALPMFTIDHIAVPGTTSKARHVAVDRRLSDHDAYVVDL